MATDTSHTTAADPKLPLVSIIMSVYNCEATLTEAVESIFNQTYTNWEFIVCDDASTDGTLELLTQLAERDRLGRVKIITNDTNMRTVQIGIRFFLANQERGTNWGALMAGAVIVMLPTLLLFLIANRQLVKGIAMTGLKG